MKRLTLIQQNDTHAQIELHWEHFWKNGEATYRKTGGVARIASLLNEFRKTSGSALLFLDSGDEIHGTAVAQWTQGAALIPLLRALRIDAMTPGNWEFGFGPEVLWQRIEELECPVLACNLENANTGESSLPACHVTEAGGLRVGMIGLTSPIVTERMPRSFGAGLRFSDGIDVLPAHIENLRVKDRVDLVILISHMGLAQDLQLVSQIQGIDVVLSGHTHDRLHEPVVAGKTILIQSGFSGSFLGLLDLTIDGQTIVDFQHRLVEVGESIHPDGEVADLVRQQMDPYQNELNEVAGETLTPLHRMSLLETPMDNLITDAYVDLTGAEVAFSHGWRYGAPIVPGPVTMADVWQMIPTNPEVFTAELTGEEIRTLLEHSFESVYASPALRQKGGYPIRVSGLSAVVRQNNSQGARIQELFIGDEPYRPAKRYQVAGAGEQDLRRAENKHATGIHAVDAIRKYLRKSRVNCAVTHAKFVAV